MAAWDDTHHALILLVRFTQGIWGNDPKSLSIVIPATPSNPSISYVKRTSKSWLSQVWDNQKASKTCHGWRLIWWTKWRCCGSRPRTTFLTYGIHCSRILMAFKKASDFIPSWIYPWDRQAIHPTVIVLRRKPGSHGLFASMIYQISWWFSIQHVTWPKMHMIRFRMVPGESPRENLGTDIIGWPSFDKSYNPISRGNFLCQNSIYFHMFDVSQPFSDANLFIGDPSESANFGGK